MAKIFIYYAWLHPFTWILIYLYEQEKLAKNENALSIRGDEIKHLDSLSHSMNINLLVPDDK